MAEIAKREPPSLLDAARATMIFCGPRVWCDEDIEEWRRLTGTTDEMVTVDALYAFVREAVAVAEGER
jgi:hypothetical protein